MLPKVLLQITQLAVRSLSNGPFAKGVNMFVLVIFMAGDFTLPFLFWGLIGLTVLTEVSKVLCAVLGEEN